MATLPSPALTVVGRQALRDVEDVLERLCVIRLDCAPEELPLVWQRIDAALDARNSITRPYREHP
jgi:hypothetical protein